nr:MAG TPA: hypothetical protein [Caudoviricetes sp.]
MLQSNRWELYSKTFPSSSGHRGNAKLSKQIYQETSNKQEALYVLDGYVRK